MPTIDFSRFGPSFPSDPDPVSSPVPSLSSPVSSARSGRPDPFTALSHLTDRDRELLVWLAEHFVLTTEQIAQALYQGSRYAQRRMAVLERLGVISRFSFGSRFGTGSASYRHVLGPVGVQLYPTSYVEPGNPFPKAIRSDVDRRLRIANSPFLEHQLGVNQFFIDLYTDAKDRDDRGLLRWWSELHATAAFGASGVRPDGHGVWAANGRVVGFFLEHDRGTSDLGRLLGKLEAYGRLAGKGGSGPRYPVLLHTDSRLREHNLLRELTQNRTKYPFVVATTVHGADPAGPVWALPGDPGPRLRLDELPSDHGPAGGLNSARFGTHHADLAPPGNTFI